MRLFRIILVINTLLLLFVNCKTPFTTSKKIEKIEITDIRYSKMPPKYDKILLSTITNCNKKYFTSAIGGTFDNKSVDYPINDKYFNHEYFSNFDYNSTKKAKLYVQKYTYEGKEYFVAVKIE